MGSFSLHVWTVHTEWILPKSTQHRDHMQSGPRNSSHRVGGNPTQWVEIALHSGEAKIATVVAQVNDMVTVGHSGKAHSSHCDFPL